MDTHRLARRCLLTVVLLSLTLLLLGVLRADPIGAAGEPIVAPYDSSGLVWGDALPNTLVLFNTGNTKGVSSGPTTPATFTTVSTYTIVSISTYHFGSTASPGSISLRDANGDTVGSWTASGLSGNVYWYVRPNITIGPGTYTVVDSSPSTWSYTLGGPTSGMGFTRVLASTSPNSTTTTSTTTTTTSTTTTITSTTSTTTPPTTSTTMPPPTTSTTSGGSGFPDVPTGSPYYAAITDLASQGVIGGYANGDFGPNDKVTRQQFAKMIVLALGLPVTGSEICPFTDVPTQSGTDPFYPSKYVAVCAAQGITSGKTPKTFEPGKEITHQQLITMVARAAGLSAPAAGYVPGFTAAQFSSTDHYNNACAAAYAGLLEGLVGIGPGYDFLAGSTRGECAQLLYNLRGKSQSVNVSEGKATASIGADGGRVTLDDGASLKVAPGALARTALVGLEKFTTPEGFGSGATAYEINGLTGMTGTAELVMPAEKGLSQDEISVCSYYPAQKKVGTIPYTYDPAAGTVTVPIGPAGFVFAAAGDLRAASSVQIPGGGVLDGVWAVLTTEKEYKPEASEVLIRTPFYQQAGGSCLAADAAMIIAGLVPPEQRVNLGGPLSYVKASDADFGISGESPKFHQLLRSYLKSRTGATVNWRGYMEPDHLKWFLLRELDKGHPIIYKLGGIGHWVLIVGYKRSGSEFILQDSKGVKPPDGRDGGMYTVRSWEWLLAQKGMLTSIVHVMWAEAEPNPPNLLSVGCPGADESGGASDWWAKFRQTDPLSGKSKDAAVLQFRPSAPGGLRWHLLGQTVETISNEATSLNMQVPVWNAGTGTASGTLKVSVRSGVETLFEWSTPTLTLPAGGRSDTETWSALPSVDINTELFRDLKYATKSAALPLQIDCQLLDGGTYVDGFTLRATLSVRPKIAKVEPSATGKGSKVTITGYCFGTKQSKLSAVTVGGKTVSIVSWSDNKIVIAIPGDAQLGTNLPVIVTTGETYPYQSDPSTLSITDQTTIGETYTDTDNLGSCVVKADVQWQLTGGNAMIDIKDPATTYYSLRVKKDVPFTLTLSATASLEPATRIEEVLKDPSRPKSQTNPVVGYNEYIYHASLYPPTLDWVVDKREAPPLAVVNSSESGFAIQGTFTSFTQWVGATLSFRITYDRREYDAAMQLKTETRDVFYNSARVGDFYVTTSLQ